MNGKTAMSLCAGLSLIIAATITPAQAGKHTARNILLGVTAAIGAAAVVGAVTSASRARANAPDRLGFRDRALEVCMRAADRDNARRGGDGVEFLQLKRAKRKSYGVRMKILLRSYEPWGSERRVIKCKVRRNLRLKSIVWY